MTQIFQQTGNQKSVSHRHKIAMILTCFNRRQKTVDCIDSVLAQSAFSDVTIDFFITDDGSKDGTSDALLLRHPEIRLLKGNGSLFWNGGMRLAWAEAIKEKYDFFLWLNDDTFLYPDTLRRMLDTHAKCMHKTGKAGIVVGSTHDETGQTSYGGELQKSRLRPLTLTKLDPKEEVQPCDTFNGNCVLISRDAAEVLGNLDAGLVHAMGDIDYGLRAKQAGIPMWVMPFYAGRCVNDNDISGSFGDRSLPVTVRLKKIFSPKGLPWRAWLIVCRRHAGYLWPIYWIWPYLKVLVTSFHIKERKTTTPYPANKD
jgi:glycosyltransferase involved in cell wall biosynthesis